MDLQAELAARLGVVPAVPIAEGSDLESSVAPSESVSAAGGKKKKKKKRKHKDKGLAEEDDDIEKSSSKPKGDVRVCWFMFHVVCIMCCKFWQKPYCMLLCNILRYCNIWRLF